GGRVGPGISNTTTEPQINTDCTNLNFTSVQTCFIRVHLWLVYCLFREAVAVFTRHDEGLDHFRLFEVAAGSSQLVEPVLEARGIRIAPEIAEVFHHHKRIVKLRTLEAFIFGNSTQRLRAGQRALSQAAHEVVALAGGELHTGVAD